MRVAFNDTYTILFKISFIKADVFGTLLNCLNNFVEAVQMNIYNNIYFY